MKRILILFSLIPVTVFAPITTEYIIRNDHFRRTIQRSVLIESIIHVESSGNPLAYNKKEQAAGIIQIRPVMLNYINRTTGSKYTLQDRFDKDKSIAMFDSLMKYRNPDYNLKLSCYLWNSGRSYYVQAVQPYLSKVQKAFIINKKDLPL